MALSDLILAETSLAHFWNFGEGTGASVENQANASYPAVLTGTYTRGDPGLVPGEAGNSTYFDGSTAYATAGNCFNFEHDQAFTVLVVARQGELDLVNNEVLLAKRDGVQYQERGVDLRVFADQRARAFLTSDNSTTAPGTTAYIGDLYSHTTNPLGAQLYVMTYSGASNGHAGLGLYINGVPVVGGTNANTSLTTQTFDTTASLTVGADYYSGAMEAFFNGHIQHVAIFDEALSDATIYAMGAAWHTPYAKALIEHADIEAMWPLNDTTGTVATEVFSQYPGTYTGGYTLGADSLVPYGGDYAVDLDGTTGYITCGDVLDKEYNQAFSVSLLVQLDSALPSAAVTLVDKLAASAPYGYKIIVNTDGTLRVALINTSATYHDEVYTTAVFDWSQSHHVVAVFGYTSGDHSASEMALYVDGVAQATTTAFDTLTTQTTVNAASLAFGARVSAGPGVFLPGTIQYVAFFDAALSAGDVADLYAVYRAQVAMMDDSLYLSSSVTSTVGIFLGDGVTLSASTISYARYLALSDLIRLTDGLTLSQTHVGVFSDVLRLVERIAPGYSMGASDALSISNTLHLGVGVPLADQLALSDYFYRHYAMNASDAVALAERLVYGYSVLLADAAKLSEAVLPGYSLVLVDQAVLEDSVSRSVSFSLSASDEVSLVETVAAHGAFVASLFDRLMAGGVLTLDGVQYSAWVLNTKNLAPSRYEGFDFTSVAGGYGVRSDGVYQLEGDDDAGTAIAASVETGLLSHGTSLTKTIPDAYLAVTSDGALYLKVTTSNDGSLVEDWYQAIPVYSGPDTVRYSIGKGLRARFWKYRLESAGADFEISDLEVRALALKRRL